MIGVKTNLSVPCIYIENQDQAYIDVGLPLSTKMRMELKVQNVAYSPYGRIFCSGYGDLRSNNTIQISVEAGQIRTQCYGATYVALDTQFVDWYDHKPHVFIYDNNAIYCDGKLGHSIPIEEEKFTNWNLLLLSKHEPLTTEISFARIFYCKVWDKNRILIRDMIPVLADGDTYGLYDRVEGKFFVSPNGSKFIGK